MIHHDPHGSEVGQETQGSLSVPDKLLKMVEFWMHHNEEHARSYRDWGGRAREMGLDEIGLILEKLAGEAVLPNQDLKQVLMLLKAQPASH